MEKFLSMFFRASKCPVFFFFIGFLILASSTAHACSCAFYSPSITMQSSSVIILIEVLDEKYDFPYLSEIYPKDVEDDPEGERKLKRQTANLAVKKVWKGSFGKTAIFSSVLYSSCDSLLPVGGPYLLYGWQNGDLVGTSHCYRTRGSKNIEVEMEILDLFVKGTPLAKIHEYLVNIMESKRETRFRQQAASLLFEDLSGYHDIVKYMQSKNKTKIPEYLAPYLPKGFDPSTFPKLTQRAWRIASKDPSPEIRKDSLHFMQFLDIPKSKADKQRHAYLKDSSIIVRSRAVSELLIHNQKEKQKEENHALLQKVIADEKNFLTPIDPKEKAAQRSMIQGIISYMIKGAGKTSPAWMRTHILQDLASEFPSVRKSALYNFRRLKPATDEHNKQVLSAYRKELEKQSTRPATSNLKEESTYAKRKRINAKKEIILYLIKHGTEEDKNSLLPDIVEDLNNNDPITASAVIEILKHLMPISNKQSKDIRLAVYSRIEKEKELIDRNPASRDVRRKRIQDMISIFINQMYAEKEKKFIPKTLQDFSMAQELASKLAQERIYKTIKPLIPEIMQDFKGEPSWAQDRAFWNLYGLKPLNEDLLERLEEVYQNTDLRYQPRVRRQINQLKKPVKAYFY